MDIDECMLVKEQFHYLMQGKHPYALLAPGIVEPIEYSKKIFYKLYSKKDIGQHKQALLYADDILFLNTNCADFKENHFVIKLEGWAINHISEALDRQFGEFIVITKDMANKLLIQAKLDNFKNRKSKK